MTQPEQININELKRLLVETVYDLVDYTENSRSAEQADRFIRRVVRNIENANLNGDDS
jgi:hypothetical protein